MPDSFFPLIFKCLTAPISTVVIFVDCSITSWNEMPTYFIPQDALNAPGNPMWIPEFQGSPWTLFSR